MNQESKYLKYLPAIYTEEGDKEPAFLTRFLFAFEKILSGSHNGEDNTIKGIEEILDRSADFFDPYKTPPEFLKWLAGCVALTLKEGEDWNGEDFTDKSTSKEQNLPLMEERNTKNRKLISEIVRLYQKRGTRKGLEEYLKIYVGEEIQITINEFIEPFQAGVTSEIGENTVVGEGRPYYFEVHMVLPAPDPKLLEQKRRQIKNIIDREKPAHTYYELITEVPTLEVGEHSTIGSDTLLGGEISA